MKFLIDYPIVSRLITSQVINRRFLTKILFAILVICIKYISTYVLVISYSMSIIYFSFLVWLNLVQFLCNSVV